jgi:hypothetical protein
MQRYNLKKICSLSMLIWIFAGGTQSFAQGLNSSQRPASEQKKTVAVDEDFLKEVQRQAAERDKFKSQADALTEVVTAKDAQIAALRGLLQIEQQISADWKTSALARKDALKTDDKLILQFEKREAQLQSDLAAAKRNGRLYGVGGFVAGVLVAVFVKGNN